MGWYLKSDMYGFCDKNMHIMTTARKKYEK